FPAPAVAVGCPIAPPQPALKQPGCHRARPRAGSPRLGRCGTNVGARLSGRRAASSPRLSPSPEGDSFCCPERSDGNRSGGSIPAPPPAIGTYEQTAPPPGTSPDEGAAKLRGLRDRLLAQSLIAITSNQRHRR